MVYKGKAFSLGPAGTSAWGQVAVAEILFTFVLCYVVLCVAVNPKTKSAEFYGLAIGSCVTVGGFAIGAISGGSLNPAVSFGIATSSLLNKGSIIPAFAYSLFELVGGVLAAGLMMVTHMDAEETQIPK